MNTQKTELTEVEKEFIQHSFWIDILFDYLNSLIEGRYNKWKEEWIKYKPLDIQARVWQKIIFSNPKNSDILKALWKI